MAGLTLAGCGSSENLVFQTPPPADPVTLQTVTILNQATLAFGSDGTPYRLDFIKHTVTRQTLTGETVWKVGELGAGDGIFNFPVALQADDSGRLFVADRGNGEVEVLDTDGRLLGTYGRGELNTARDIALDLVRDLLYVCDSPAHRVAVFSLNGAYLRDIGSFGFSGSELNSPTGVDVADNGEVHIVDSGNAQIQVHDANGNYLRSYGERGTALGQFNTPRSVVIDSQGNSLVADGVGGFITRFDGTGQALDRFRPTTPSGITVSPQYLSLGPSDLLVVTGNPTFQATV